MKTLALSLFSFVCAVGLLGASPVRAAGNQINFSGAVMAPTCTLSTATAIPESSREDIASLSCGQGAGQVTTFSSHVTAIGSQSSDPLLGYFAGYVSAGGAGQAASVMTRTYE